MNKFRCFVLTRFNLAIDYNLNDNQVQQKIWLDENYLTTRLELFQKYCIPSLLNQTDRDFEWIVMFHSETRDYHKAIVSEIVKKYPFIHVLYLNDEECRNYMDILADYIQGLVDEDEYITTRIDNDDMYHPTYIEEVKKQFAKLKEEGKLKSRHVVSYQMGIQYSIHTNGVLRLEWDCNHFLALYCKKSEKAHILMYNHTQIRKHYSDDCFVLINPTKPMWVETVSGSNVINDMRYYLINAKIPYVEAKEFPNITLPWKNKMQWKAYVAKTYVYIFFKCGVGRVKRDFAKLRK